MAIDARWTPAALTAAVLMLYFTPWLTFADAANPRGFDLVHAGIAAMPGFEAISAYAPLLVAGTLPAPALIALVADARGRAPVPWPLLASVAGLAVAPWLGVLGAYGNVHIEPTWSGIAVIGAAFGVVICAAHRVGETAPPRIVERRQRNGSAAIDVCQNRWRPLHRMLGLSANVAILFVAFDLLFAAYLPGSTPLLRTLGAAGVLVVGGLVLATLRKAARRAPSARIFVDHRSLAVTAGGDCGRYPREHIGGLYIPQYVDESVANYYAHRGTRNTLTLPVVSRSQAPAPPSPWSLFADTSVSVAMNLRERTVTLARHLTDAQAAELVRRLTIRLST